ncbi:MAG: hypothetical protein JSS87_07360 [Acidobacteria bacterium]|nr:hypothetical protein [Acidobacteriota bacterium]
MIKLRTSCIASMVLMAVTAAPLHAAIPFFGKKDKKDKLPVRKLSAAQSALIDKAIAREKEVVKTLKERAPLVETYIQNMKPDAALLQVPESDQHFLSRVEFDKVIGNENYTTSPKKAGHQKGSKLGFFKNSLSAISHIADSLHLEFQSDGFVRMLILEQNNFNRQNYTFVFVRNDFVGSVPAMAFDVTPVKMHPGQFLGRIWIERNGGNIIRFTGSFAGTQKEVREFYHFDSWRTNVQENLWLPTSIYVEESDENSEENTLKFKAINHVWGYMLQVPPKEAENVDIEVAGATDVSQDAQDVSPLGAQRAWVQQAEDNVIDRLYKAGLLDAPSDFDKTLEQVAGNILAYNQIQVSRPIRCRTLLTEPLESVAIGNTIILSKGLIDTTSVPGNNNEQVSNLYAIVAFQLAHIITGHRLDTKYAFNDRLLFPDTSTFSRIPMHHTDKDNEEAAKETLKLLEPKELQDAQAQFGLYLAQLQQRSKALKALNEPMLGDSLIKDPKENTFWLQALIGKGPKLDMNDLKQQAAMPLSAFLRFDPWTDQVVQIHAPYEPLLSSRDKMPFEVTPVFMKLSYYKPPVDANGAAAADQNAAPAGTNAAPGETTTAPSAGATAAPAGETAAPSATEPGTAAPATETTTPPPAGAANQ